MKKSMEQKLNPFLLQSEFESENPKCPLREKRNSKKHWPNAFVEPIKHATRSQHNKLSSKEQANKQRENSISGEK